MIQASYRSSGYLKPVSIIHVEINTLAKSAERWLAHEDDVQGCYFRRGFRYPVIRGGTTEKEMPISTAETIAEFTLEYLYSTNPHIKLLSSTPTHPGFYDVELMNRIYYDSITYLSSKYENGLDEMVYKFHSEIERLILTHIRPFSMYNTEALYTVDITGVDMVVARHADIRAIRYEMERESKEDCIPLHIDNLGLDIIQGL